MPSGPGGRGRPATPVPAPEDYNRGFCPSLLGACMNSNQVRAPQTNKALVAYRQVLLQWLAYRQACFNVLLAQHVQRLRRWLADPGEP